MFYIPLKDSKGVCGIWIISAIFRALLIFAHPCCTEINCALKLMVLRYAALFSDITITLIMWQFKHLFELRQPFPLCYRRDNFRNSETIVSVGDLKSAGQQQNPCSYDKKLMVTSTVAKNTTTSSSYGSCLFQVYYFLKGELLSRHTPSTLPNF